MTQPQRSFYDEVGGHETFRAIVARFYELVREDEILRPLYPEEDLEGAETRLRMFLEQYWGGPHTYTQDTLRILRESGYSVAFNTVRRHLRLDDPLFELPRIDTRDLPPYPAGERDSAPQAATEDA